MWKKDQCSPLEKPLHLSDHSHRFRLIKTQLEIGKEYEDTPRGSKSNYAAQSPYQETILRRFAKKYREMKEEGQIKGVTLTLADLRKTRIVKASKVHFPKSEKRLVRKFRKLRKVGVSVSGPYLRAKMLQYVKQEKNADPNKVKSFKASNMWLRGFMERKGISVRARTNKKNRSAVKRSRLVRNWHWNIMYKLPYEFSKQKKSF